MLKAARHRLRHTRRVLGYGALVVLIAFATLVGLANQLLPLVERHPEKIAQWLSERVGEPVAFDRAHAEWTRRGPRFTLDGLRVGAGDDPLRIGRAQLQVAIYSGLLPGRPLTELKVRELSLRLVQDADRRWKLVGLPGQGRGGDPLDTLEGFGELQIEKARLVVDAPRYQLALALPRVDLRIRVGERRIRAGASVWADLDRAPIRAVAELGRGDYAGQLWAGGDQLAMHDWSPLLAASGIHVLGGNGRLGVWAQVSDRKVNQVTVDADVTRLSLASADALARAEGAPRPVRSRFDRVRATARWRLRGARWELQAPTLRFTRAGKDATLDGLALVGDATARLQAERLDLAPLASLLALSPKLPAGLRAWLDAAQPRAMLHDVSLQRDAKGQLRGHLRVSELALDPVGTRPGFSGLGAAVRFDGEGGIARLADAPMRFRWPAGFRQELDVGLTGSVGWWRTGEGWNVGTSGLRVDGGDFSANVRAQMGFQGDGSKPRLDLAADLGPASFATAKKFWIVHLMPPSSVRWLDDALVSGTVEHGRVVVAGDLDDWPFRAHTGVFDARAHIRDATVHFSPEWPAAQDLDIDVAFDGPGFTLAGSGELAGNHVASVQGGIADFSAALLHLDIDADGRGETLRSLLLASPLQKEYGEHLRAAKVTGPAQVKMALNLLLHGGPAPPGAPAPPRRIEGELHLRDATLADSRWDLAFDQVNGAVRFSDGGFATEPLDVRFDQQPAQFALRVGHEFTGDPRLAGLGTLHGRFTPATLIRRYPALHWLEARMVGASTWDVQVQIPAAVAGQRTPPSQLRVATDLRGTAIGLPAPLDKPADETWPLEVTAPLPIDQGEIAVHLRDVLQMRAVQRENGPMRGALQFGGGAAPAPPAQGLSVHGTADKLDAAGWIAFASDDTATGGEGSGATTLHDIDLTAHRFLLVDRAFPDTRLRMDRGGAGTRLALDGATLQGTVEIPSDPARAVQGKFARMWWASGTGATTATGSTAPSSPAASNGGAASSTPTPAADAKPATPAAPATADTTAAPSAFPASPDADPTHVPPLHFVIDDLRLGLSQLGQAELSTTRTASGMRIDRFQTRAKSLSLDAAGEWVRAGGGSRSNLKLEFQADNLGQMLDALGFKGMVDGGKTQATLTGSWPGSPGAFSLAKMSGTLHATVGEGRLLDVEPGGSGRILGLISLAEIPRRLTLDFSDFFAKGFSFNTVRGDFTFSDGQARTDNLRLDGPAAEIRVSGAADLRRETYDQRVEVLPKAGGVLPALGMLAGGPAGAAVGVVAQAMLQKPLKQQTRTVYRITGPWKKPDVVVVEKGPARDTDADKQRNRTGESR
jgi:uncharacterized protein (TIGR02099 family)